MIVWRIYPSFYSLIVCHASFVTWVWAFTCSKIPSQHPWPQKGFFFHWIIQTSQLLIITLSSSTLFRVKQFLIKNSLWFPWSIEKFFPTPIWFHLCWNFENLFSFLLNWFFCVNLFSFLSVYVESIFLAYKYFPKTWNWLADFTSNKELSKLKTLLRYS